MVPGSRFQEKIDTGFSNHLRKFASSRKRSTSDGSDSFFTANAGLDYDDTETEILYSFYCQSTMASNCAGGGCGLYCCAGNSNSDGRSRRTKQ
jgi:hypothetical protein